MSLFGWHMFSANDYLFYFAMFLVTNYGALTACPIFMAVAIRVDT